MKKFFQNLCIYFFVLIVITISINYFYKSESNETDKFKNIPDNIQICNLGSSHGNDFDYSNFESDYKCFKFSLSGQALRNDYIVLKYFKNNLQKGAKVFIIVSYQHLFRQGSPSMDERYYKFLPPEEIRDYDEKINFYSNYFPALATKDLISLFEKLLDFKFITMDPYTEMNPENAKKMAERRFVNLIKKQIVKDENGKRKTQDKYLYDIINLCHEIEAEPILITTPYLKEFSDEIKRNDKDFHNDFYSLVNEVASNTGTKYYDFSNDERFTHDYSLFIDVDHLNKKGAEKFTEIIFDEILGIKN